MEKHKELLENKFSHSNNDLLYNSGGGVMWSLFGFESGSVTVYYHDIDEYHIISKDKAKWFDLAEIADKWDPISKQIQ